MNANTKKAMEEFVLTVCGMAGIISAMLPLGASTGETERRGEGWNAPAIARKYLSEVPTKGANLLNAINSDETLMEVN